MVSLTVFYGNYQAVYFINLEATNTWKYKSIKLYRIK